MLSSKRILNRCRHVDQFQREWRNLKWWNLSCLHQIDVDQISSRFRKTFHLFESILPGSEYFRLFLSREIFHFLSSACSFCYIHDSETFAVHEILKIRTWLDREISFCAEFRRWLVFHQAEPTLRQLHPPAHLELPYSMPVHMLSSEGDFWWYQNLQKRRNLK